jgi:hypothetical protein
MNILDLIFENFVPVFRVKNTSLIRTRTRDLVNPGSGMEELGSGVEDPA